MVFGFAFENTIKLLLPSHEEISCPQELAATFAEALAEREVQ